MWQIVEALYGGDRWLAGDPGRLTGGAQVIGDPLSHLCIEGQRKGPLLERFHLPSIWKSSSRLVPSGKGEFIGFIILWLWLLGTVCMFLFYIEQKMTWTDLNWIGCLTTRSTTRFLWDGTKPGKKMSLFVISTTRRSKNQIIESEWTFAIGPNTMSILYQVCSVK